ncbi:MAG: PAS/PAC sensor hybrid histidine kinase [Parcubacteria group bacterium Licking1014_1]|nr:MAG: PAS/PAC sensor hybrid histidine kinase [Parcubacteria group bacterium Licking1014_1]
MENNKNITKDDKEIALHYMKTLVDVARESFLILDADIEVVSANDVFYQTFEVKPAQTEGVSLYKLGNGQWNIPELKKLLENILPNKKVVKNYEVEHVFETIGRKTMVLNARQIDTVQLIILAIEDMTVRRELEEKLAKYTKGLEIKGVVGAEELAARVKELEALNKTMVGRELKMVELKKEIEELKKKTA